MVQISHRFVQLFPALLLVGFAPPANAKTPSLAVQAGYASGLDGQGGPGSYAVGATVLWPLSHRFSLGVDGGFLEHENARQDFQTCIPPSSSGVFIDCAFGNPDDLRVRGVRRKKDRFGYLAALVRLDAFPDAIVRPYGVAGMGAYFLRNWSSETLTNAETGEIVTDTARSADLQVVPGVTLGAGIDFTPNFLILNSLGTRLGVGLGARVHLGGRFDGNSLLGIAVYELFGGVTLWL